MLDKWQMWEFTLILSTFSGKMKMRRSGNVQRTAGVVVMKVAVAILRVCLRWWRLWVRGTVNIHFSEGCFFDIDFSFVTSFLICDINKVQRPLQTPTPSRQQLNPRLPRRKA
jgi:hypothetical protein